MASIPVHRGKQTFYPKFETDSRLFQTAHYHPLRVCNRMRSQKSTACQVSNIVRILSETIQMIRARHRPDTLTRDHYQRVDKHVAGSAVYRVKCLAPSGWDFTGRH